MLLEHFPHRDFEDHPIFRFTARRVRGARSAAGLRRYTVVVGAVLVLILSGLWLLVILSSIENCIALRQNCYRGDSDSGAFILLLALGSIALNIILDFACVIAAFQSLNNEHTGTQWDLLRLTEQQETMIVAAKHALAKVRAWRVMAVVVALRVAVPWLLLLQFVTFELLVWGDRVRMSTPWLRIDTWLIVASLGVCLAVFILEPVWRMRAVTALGLAVVMRFRSVMSGSLAAFAAILLLWIVQIIILGAMLWLTVRLASGAGFMLVLIPLCGSILGAVVIYHFYRLLEQRMIQRAITRCFVD